VTLAQRPVRGNGHTTLHQLALRLRGNAHRGPEEQCARASARQRAPANQPISQLVRGSDRLLGNGGTVGAWQTIRRAAGKGAIGR
jgi:hypothetical protein